MTTVSMGRQPGRGKSEFLLLELCILGWVHALPEEVHRGTLRPAAEAVDSGDLPVGERDPGVWRSAARVKSHLLLQWP